MSAHAEKTVLITESAAGIGRAAARLVALNLDAPARIYAALARSLRTGARVCERRIVLCGKPRPASGHTRKETV